MQNEKTVEVTEVVDSAKFIGLPLGITCLTVLMMLVDGFDLQTMPFVAPALIDEWGLDRSLMGPTLAANQIGMAIGSIALGALADRIGRRASYIICLAFLFVGSLLCAFSTELNHLFWWRILTGIGLGGVTPLAATMISEWTPKRVRNVAVAFAVVAVPTGGMIGAGIAQWIIPTYGWRTIFYIGAALPLFFVFIALFLLPESPRYLATRPAKHPALAKRLNMMLRQNRFDGTEHFVVAEPPRPPANWFVTLFSGRYLATSLLLCAAFLFNTLCLYSFVNWLPTVLKAASFPAMDQLQGSKLFNFGGFFGAVGGAFLIGYVGSRLVGTGLALIGAAAAALVGVAVVAAGGQADFPLLALIFVSGMALNGMQCFLYTVGAHSYPTYIRASGVGTAQTVSRLGGYLSGTFGGIFFSIKPQPPISYFFFAIGIAMLVIVVTFFSLRTHIHANRGGRGDQPLPEPLQKGAAP
jgi:AAHS family 4-hydroxybenzoate transporter-like MFS transporter